MKLSRTFWFGGIAGFGVAIIAFWIYSLQEPESAARTAVASVSRELTDTARSFSYSGPILQSLYLLMLLGFILALVLAFRRPGSLGAFAAALLSFVFGAIALWIRFFGFAQVTSSGMYHGDYREDVRRMQRPFESGLTMSSMCLLIYFTRPRQPK